MCSSHFTLLFFDRVHAGPLEPVATALSAYCFGLLSSIPTIILDDTLLWSSYCSIATYNYMPEEVIRLPQGSRGRLSWASRTMGGMSRNSVAFPIGIAMIS
jgi:hypothetical protein